MVSRIATPPLPPKRLFRIFCDESGTGCRYMVFGGVVVQPASMSYVTEIIAGVRTKHAIHGEFKWGKVSRTKLPAYLGLVEAFESLTDHIHFKALIVDSSQIDYRKYHEGDHELGFYKFYWHLLYYKFNHYLQTDGDAALVTLDDRPTRYPLNKVKGFLNRKYRYQKGLLNPIRDVVSCCSKKSDFIQLADVLSGAVGYHCNGHDLAPGCSPARTQLAARIAELANVERLSEETRWRQVYFEIWPLRFRQPKK